MRNMNISNILFETKVFTQPFIHTNRLIEMKMFDVTNNGGAWRTHFEKIFRITVVYTTNRDPIHRNTTGEDEESTTLTNLINPFYHAQSMDTFWAYMYGDVFSRFHEPFLKRYVL